MMPEKQRPLNRTFGLSCKIKSARRSTISWLLVIESCSTRTCCWMWDDYGQLGATRLIVHLSSHIQRAFVVKLLLTLKVIKVNKTDYQEDIFTGHVQCLAESLNCTQVMSLSLNVYQCSADWQLAVTR